MKQINYLGLFATLDELWDKYPEGGLEGDYAAIGNENTFYCWNPYTDNWADPDNPEPVDPESRPRPLFTHEGDVRITHDLTVAGTLRARRVKQPNVGLFKTEDSLKARYPEPQEPGMWAAVGTTMPADLWMVNESGQWEPTGEKGGVDGLDTEAIDDLEEGLRQEIAHRAAGDDELAAALAKKADKSYVDSNVEELTTRIVGESEARARDIENVSHDVSLKASKLYVDNELAKKADKSYVDSNVEELTTRIVGESEARARDIENVSHDVSLKASKLYVDNELAKKADKTELAGKANLNSQGALATGEEQRLVVDFVNIDGKHIEVNIPGVYYNGATAKIETYKRYGEGMMSIVLLEFSEEPSANVVYCDKAENKLYRWDGTAMVQVGGGGSSVDAYTKDESDEKFAAKADLTAGRIAVNGYENLQEQLDNTVLFTDYPKKVNRVYLAGVVKVNSASGLTVDDDGFISVDMVQTTGQATDKVMSQKAVSDLIGNVEQLLASI